MMYLAKAISKNLIFVFNNTYSTSIPPVRKLSARHVVGLSLSPFEVQYDFAASD